MLPLALVSLVTLSALKLRPRSAPGTPGTPGAPGTQQCPLLMPQRPHVLQSQRPHVRMITTGAPTAPCVPGWPLVAPQLPHWPAKKPLRSHVRLVAESTPPTTAATTPRQAKPEQASGAHAQWVVAVNAVRAEGLELDPSLPICSEDPTPAPLELRSDRLGVRIPLATGSHHFGRFDVCRLFPARPRLYLPDPRRARSPPRARRR